MNRVSEDGNKVVVRVDESHIRSTKYGNVQLQLDKQHAVYLKQWQVEPHTDPYKGQNGFEVVLDKKYFTPKQTRYANKDFPSDESRLSFGHWRKVAEKQDRSGNTVSIRA